MWHKPIDIRIIYPYIYLKNKSYEKKSFSSSDYFGLFEDIVDIICRLASIGIW